MQYDGNVSAGVQDWSLNTPTVTIMRVGLTGIYSCVGHVNQEDVDEGLRWSDHVLCRSDKVDDGVVEFCTLPTVGWLVRSLVPIEELGYFVRQVAHAALPSVAVLQEGHVWIDVGPAPSATSDDGVRDHGYLVLLLLVRLDASVRGNDQG